MHATCDLTTGSTPSQFNARLPLQFWCYSHNVLHPFVNKQRQVHSVLSSSHKMALTATQQGVVRGMCLAVATTLAIFAACSVFKPTITVDPVTNWLTWNIPKVATLAASIAMLANHRFFTAEDINVSGTSQGTAQARVLQAVLQNTLEQLVLAVVVHGAWAAIMPADLQAVVIAASIMFLLGRLMFFHGYSQGAPARAFGFALTFYPTMIMMAVMIVTWLSSCFR